MQVETLRDVINWTYEFHRHLTERLTEGASQTKSERCKMLLDYMSEHEQRLAHTVREYEKTGNEHALNTWCYEYLDKHPIIHHHYTDTQFSELSSINITQLVIHQHKQVIDLYRYLAERADIRVAKDLLNDLLSLEEHEIMVMAQSANRLEDM